eukprot:16434198-Heterocapsa_arctica.AAC.1
MDRKDYCKRATMRGKDVRRQIRINQEINSWIAKSNWPVFYMIRSNLARSSTEVHKGKAKPRGSHAGDQRSRGQAAGGIPSKNTGGQR